MVHHAGLRWVVSPAAAARSTNSKPKRPLMHRWPSVTDESSGEVTFTIRLSWTCRSTAQPTPQYGQIVVGHGLGRLVPGAGRPHVVLGLEHQRAGRADADAVAAVDARGLGQRHGLLGRDPGVEAAAGDGDRERVLGVLAARLDALVAEDALRVVADVEVVVDLRRLGDRGRGGIARRRVVMARLVRVALAGAARPAAGGPYRDGSAPYRVDVARGSPSGSPVRPATRRPTSRGTPAPPCATCRTRSDVGLDLHARPRPCASRPARGPASR